MREQLDGSPVAWEILLADSFHLQMTANIMGEDEAEAKFSALCLAQAYEPHHFWTVVQAKKLN